MFITLKGINKIEKYNYFEIDNWNLLYNLNWIISQSWLMERLSRLFKNTTFKIFKSTFALRKIAKNIDEDR